MQLKPPPFKRLSLFTSGWLAMLFVSATMVLCLHWWQLIDPFYRPLDQAVSQQTLSKPTYFPLLIYLAAGLSIACFFAANRLRISISSLLFLLMAIVLWVSYGWLAIQQQLKIPVLEISALLLPGWVFGLLEKFHQQPLKTVLTTNNQWGALAARYHQQNNQLPKAWEILQQLRATPENLELKYQLAEECERKRDYQLAKVIYHQLSLHKRGFKDSREKLARLTQMRQTNPNMNGTLLMDSTLVMPGDGLQPPTLGRYRIDSVLGKGAMGVVYRGIDPAINREVAIKTLALSQEFEDQDEQNARDRFFREAETAGKLNHPNIVTIYDVGEEHDLAFIAMDLLTGVPLDNHIKPDHLLPVSLVYQLMLQIAAGLDYAHNKGVVHRDIKPANIIYDDEKQSVIITDFGIAHVTDQSKTRTGAILGSPFYMSPEQIQGKKVDGRSDIFSLGVTFYQLLTGQLPFRGDSLASVALNITTKKHEPVRKIRADLPASASRIINKALQKESDKRYQSIAELKDALTNALKRDFNTSPFR